ncbi:MAG: hypothetical protein ACRCX2_03975 [Paraclostridium sp.]
MGRKAILELGKGYRSRTLVKLSGTLIKAPFTTEVTNQKRINFQLYTIFHATKNITQILHCYFPKESTMKIPISTAIGTTISVYGAIRKYKTFFREDTQTEEPKFIFKVKSLEIIKSSSAIPVSSDPTPSS